MIAGEALAGTQFELTAVAILAAVVVAGEEEGVGYLAAETAGDVDELDQPDDRRFGKDEVRTPHHVHPLRFDDLRLALDHQSEGAPYGHHRQGLERRVKRQATHHGGLRS